MGFPKVSQTRSQGPLLLIPWSENVGWVREDPGNEVVGKQNWLYLCNKYSYYYNEINILNAMFFFSQPIRIAFLYITLFTVKALLTSKDRDMDANGGKMTEKLCTNWSEKNFDSSLGKKYVTRKQINNCFAQHSMVEKEKNRLFSTKLRRREANFLGKEVISWFALMYRDRLGLVSADLKWLEFIRTVLETSYYRKIIE